MVCGLFKTVGEKCKLKKFSTHKIHFKLSVERLNLYMFISFKTKHS